MDLNIEGFVRNTWYVAGRSEDFDKSLRPLKLLDEPIVFFRRSDNSVAALEDACPHRKLPLSKGTLENDVVVCGYHGLTFDGAGLCVAAPTQENHLPASAKVRSYPTAERYGFVWIWMGDQESADPGLIIDIPHYDDPAWGTTRRGSIDIACNYIWIIDNLLDPSHVAWVHLTSFAGAGTDNIPLELSEDDDRLVVWRWIMDRPAPPYYQQIFDFPGNCDRKQHYECRLPSIAINGSVYARAGTGGDDANLPEDVFLNTSYNFITPIDADHSQYFWFQHRNSLPDDEAVSEQMFDGAITAFNEDKEILEAVHHGMKTSRTKHINLGLDAGAMRFRRMVQRRIETETGNG